MIFRGLLLEGGFWDLVSHLSLFSWIILITLISMSLFSWGVIINKWRVFKAAELDSKRFFNTFRKRSSLREAHSKCLIFKSSPLAKVFEEGFREWESFTSLKRNGQMSTEVTVLMPEEIEAIDKILEKESNVQISEMERNVAFLATSANVAPFIGLLGTCWGIMYAFLNIGVQKSASLVVVAPGIAEALVATIIGLAVAIPSVVAYNWCNTKLKFMADDLNNFSLEFLAAVTKEQTS